MERRNSHPESWCWATEDGRRWLTRLVVATLSPFGLTRGVGGETLRECFVRLGLETQVGCSPSALRGVMQAVEQAVGETTQTWEQDGLAHGEVREILGGADETFLQRMLLVCQDVSTGSLLFEGVAEDRTDLTWKAGVDERLTALGTEGWSVVSDRASALIQRAEHGLVCLSMPDFFPLMHDLVQRASFALARQLRHAHQALTHAEEGLASHQALTPPAPDGPEATAQVAVRRAEGQRWEEAQRASRQHLETLSRTFHPFDISTALPQPSAQVARCLPAEVEAIEACAERHHVPARPGARKKICTQFPALAALVDVWGQGVCRDVALFALPRVWRLWVHESLLPLVSWEHQAARTRCARKKAKIVQALEAVRAAFDTHAISQRLAPQVLAEWNAWATDRVNTFQRASSAVEGRHGSLAHMQHNHRGLPKRRYKVWTVLHHFDWRASDGTTPAARFFRRPFPDLFETVFSHIAVLPRARQRRCEVGLGQ